MSDVCWLLIGVMAAVVCVASWRALGRIADDYKETREMRRVLGRSSVTPGLTLLEALIGLLILFVSGGVVVDALLRVGGVR